MPYNFTQQPSAVTLTDLLEKIEYHRNEQLMLMEQVEEHLPEGFSIVQVAEKQSN